jgi:hypothetical protein
MTKEAVSGLADHKLYDHEIHIKKIKIATWGLCDILHEKKLEVLRAWLKEM